MNKSASVRLIKWVEPYIVSGDIYTTFYTEVDTGFIEGDKVFIEGGPYDSVDFINNNPESLHLDGYKVLDIDRTKISLKIPYTGELPTKEEPIDNFIKVYVASTQYEYEYYIQTISKRVDGGELVNRFERGGTNNLLYINSNSINFTSGDYGLTGIKDINSNTLTSLDRGFYVIEGVDLINVNSLFILGSFSQILNPNPEVINNGKLRIIGEDFYIGSDIFENERIYKFSDDKWVIDDEYREVIITKTHFRGGTFSSGEVDSGLIGSHEVRLEWFGENITWNLGTTLNLDWYSGVMGSNFFREISHFTTLNRFNQPSIQINSPNNGGSGYNYVFNTDFIGGDIINGNIFNLATTEGNLLTDSIVKDYLENNSPTYSPTYSVKLSGGVYYNSDIRSALIEGVTVISSYIRNSFMSGVKSVNSEVEDSVFLDSTWISDKVIKIQRYEESNIVWFDKSGGINYKLYKFFISPTSFLRFRNFQKFYIDGLEIEPFNGELINFFEKKFEIGVWSEFFNNLGVNRKYLVQLSTSEENRNRVGNITGSTVSLVEELEPLPSIDIYLEGGEDFERETGNDFPRPLLERFLNIDNAFIYESDFTSGIFERSKWISGRNFNYPEFRYTPIEISSGKLIISMEDKLRETPLKVGFPFFTDSLYLNLTGEKLPQNWIIDGINQVVGGRKILLKPLDNSISLQDVMDVSGIASTPNAYNLDTYLHGFKMINSSVNSGVFNHILFRGNKFTNLDIDLEDLDFTDVTNKKELLLSNIIFLNGRNELDGVTVYNSHFLSGDDRFRGIFYNSYWNGDDIEWRELGENLLRRYRISNFNGLFKSSFWWSGIFESGDFYKSRSYDLPNENVLTGLSAQVNFNNFDNIKLQNESGQSIRWTWKLGKFLGGNFHQSIFECGEFLGGNFYDADFLSGTASGSLFGKDFIPHWRTRIWSGLFDNNTVINALFKSEDYTNVNIQRQIDWLSGEFLGGKFGNDFQSGNESTWRTGFFRGGEFGDKALWKSGEFSGGKFTSSYGFINGETPYQRSLKPIEDYSWQSGTFSGGTFGTHSLWYRGIFTGGEFRGRFWRTGAFISGKFSGSGDMIPHMPTIDEVENSNNFFLNFHTDYYGYWLDGAVTKNLSDFIQDSTLYTDFEDTSVLMEGVLWKNGLFNHSDGRFHKSLFLGGEFRRGLFEKSSFNPYINVVSVVDGSNVINVQPGLTYSYIYETSNGIIQGSFTATGITHQLNPPGVIDISVFEGNSGFRKSGVLWSGGKSLESDIFLTDWKTGEFDSLSGSKLGNLWGVNWKSGEMIYGNMFNSLWHGGIWKNGNFNGSPFNRIKAVGDGYLIYPGEQSDILNFIDSKNLIYSELKNKLHYNNLFKKGGEIIENDDFRKWEPGGSKNSSLSLSPGWESMNDPYFLSGQNGLIPDSEVRVSTDTFNPFTWVLDDGDDIIFGEYGEFDITIEFIALDFSSNPVQSFSYSVQFLIGNEIEESSGDFRAFPFNPNNTNSPYLGGIKVEKKIRYSATEFTDENSFKIRIQKKSTSSNSLILAISNILIEKVDVSYDFVKNNTLIESDFINLYNEPDSDYTFLGIVTNFGNGTFLSGIWENGSWIDGFREDPLISYSDDILRYPNSLKTISYETSPKRWFYKLTADREFKPGDRVSVSNIVGIDLNGKRRLIRDFSTVVENIPNLESEVVINMESDDFTKWGTGGDKSSYLPTGWEYADDSFILSKETNFILESKPRVQEISASTKVEFAWFDISGTSSVINEIGDWEVEIEVIINDFNFVELNNFSYSFGVNIGDYSEDFSGNFKSYQQSGVFVGGTIIKKTIRYKHESNIPAEIKIINLSGRFNNRIMISSLVLNKIVYKNDVTLRVDVDFPIRTIVKDSDCHRIMISRNIWLNGAFFSGLIKKSVWSGGLFRGFPYISVADQIHWIDGVFRGGRFISRVVDNFNTGLLQSVEFYDENVSGQPFKFKFNSWMDLVYSERSTTSIERRNKVFRETPLGFTFSHTENNIYGKTTPDILESDSTIRNSHNLLSRRYKLGCKFTEYQNYLDTAGEFLGINDIRFDNNSGFINGGAVDVQNGFSDLFQNSWTFRSVDISIFASASGVIRSNIGDLDSEFLYIEGGKDDDTPNVSPAGNPKNFNLEILNNQNIVIEPLRYSFIEIEAENFSVDPQIGTGITNPILFYNTYPIEESLDSSEVLFNGNAIIIPQDQLDKPSVVNRRTYFFNKRDLDLFIFSAKRYRIRFKRIRFVETDMIPFFQIASDCVRRNKLVTWDTADINWELAGPQNGANSTWDNFYISNSENLGRCLSYINSDIVKPNFQKSPDIEYESDIVLNKFRISRFNLFEGLKPIIRTITPNGDPVGERCLCGIKEKIIVFGDEELDDPVFKPIVLSVKSISTPGLSSGGNQSSKPSVNLVGRTLFNGGSPISENGFYWGLNQNSLNNKVVANLVDDGSEFGIELDNLDNGTLYWRAFSLNESGEEGLGVIGSLEVTSVDITTDNLGNDNLIPLSSLELKSTPSYSFNYDPMNTSGTANTLNYMSELLRYFDNLIVNGQTGGVIISGVNNDDIEINENGNYLIEYDYNFIYNIVTNQFFTPDGSPLFKLEIRRVVNNSTTTSDIILNSFDISNLSGNLSGSGNFNIVLSNGDKIGFYYILTSYTSNIANRIANIGFPAPINDTNFNINIGENSKFNIKITRIN